MTDTIIYYITEITPILIAVVSAIGSIVTCVKSTKKLVAKHDENLRQEVRDLRAENRDLRAENKSNRQLMLDLTEKVDVLVDKASKVRGIDYGNKSKN